MTIEEEIAQRIDKALDGDCGYGVGESLAAVLMPLVRKAQAEARASTCRHAADVVHAEARWQWERARSHVPGAQIVAQRMQVIEATLRGFAARIEQNSEGNDSE